MTEEQENAVCWIKDAEDLVSEIIAGQPVPHDKAANIIVNAVCAMSLVPASEFPHALNVVIQAGYFYWRQPRSCEI